MPYVLAALSALVIAGSAVLIWVLGEQARKRRAERFRDRPELSHEDVWARFAANSGIPLEQVRAVVERVATLLGVPVGRLRPEDSFDGRLAPESGWGFSDETVDLQLWVEAETNVEPADIETLADLVRALAVRSLDEERS